ncbi:hypothetical protein FXO38_28065 [Capsicum annuum]|nr:hypothetical protein FXO38_28065 [Capsicum annuum]KAF3649123.1 hypothetical protein FXO37_19101 [Capsicum annuum]
MVVHKEEYCFYMLMPRLVPKNVVILGLGYVHVQKEVQKIAYAPIVEQATRVVTITVLTGLLFVKESLTPTTQKLALKIVIQELPIQSVHVSKEVQKIAYASIVVQAVRVATITVLMGLLFVKESLNPTTQKIALRIVIQILPIRYVSMKNIHFHKERRYITPLDAPPVARDTKVATI